jgi:hypothetical protein
MHRHLSPLCSANSACITADLPELQKVAEVYLESLPSSCVKSLAELVAFRSGASRQSNDRGVPRP